jgi:hypothetical protein
MDEKTAKEIQELRNRIGELQVGLLSALAEVKALTLLSTALWEKQKVEMADGRTVSEVMQLMKKAILDSRLSRLADTDMNLASKLKRKIEKYLKD